MGSSEKATQGGICIEIFNAEAETQQTVYFQFCNPGPVLRQQISVPNAQPDLGLSSLRNVLCNQASCSHSDHRSPGQGLVFRTAALQVRAFPPGAFKPGTALPPLSLLSTFSSKEHSVCFSHSTQCPLLGPLRAPPPTGTELLTALHKARAASSTGTR